MIVIYTPQAGHRHFPSSVVPTGGRATGEVSRSKHKPTPFFPKIPAKIPVTSQPTPELLTATNQWLGDTQAEPPEATKAKGNPQPVPGLDVDFRAPNFQSKSAVAGPSTIPTSAPRAPELGTLELCNWSRDG